MSDATPDTVEQWRREASEREAEIARKHERVQYGAGPLPGFTDAHELLEWRERMLRRYGL
jgi:cytosine/adenosine deaminase-related metal-dependent hydrolase